MFYLASTLYTSYTYETLIINLLEVHASEIESYLKMPIGYPLTFSFFNMALGIPTEDNENEIQKIIN